MRVVVSLLISGVLVVASACECTRAGGVSSDVRDSEFFARPAASECRGELAGDSLGSGSTRIAAVTQGASRVLLTSAVGSDAPPSIWLQRQTQGWSCGPPTSIAIGPTYACGVWGDGALRCTSEAAGVGLFAPEDGRRMSSSENMFRIAPELDWSQVATNVGDATCGLTRDGRVYCFSTGFRGLVQIDLPHPASALVVGPSAVCVLDREALAVCRPLPNRGEQPTPAGPLWHGGVPGVSRISFGLGGICYFASGAWSCDSERYSRGGRFLPARDDVAFGESSACWLEGDVVDCVGELDIALGEQSASDQVRALPRGPWTSVPLSVGLDQEAVVVLDSERVLWCLGCCNRMIAECPLAQWQQRW